MKVIGWIRQGDKAACGGVVAQGWSTATSYHRAYSYYGAKIACARGCFIAEAYPYFTLGNEQPVPHHGHRTSGGCPLISTLNDIDGLQANPANKIYPVFIANARGEWIGIEPPDKEHEQACDRYFVVIDEHTSTPARNRFYRLTLDTGEVIEGHTDQHGRTTYASSDQRVAVRLEIAPQHEIQVGE